VPKSMGTWTSEGGRGALSPSGFWKFQQNWFFSLFQLGKNKFPHFWPPPPGKVLEKSPGGSPGKNPSDAHAWEMICLHKRNIVTFNNCSSLETKSQIKSLSRFDFFRKFDMWTIYRERGKSGFKFYKTANAINMPITLNRMVYLCTPIRWYAAKMIKLHYALTENLVECPKCTGCWQKLKFDIERVLGGNEWSGQSFYYAKDRDFLLRLIEIRLHKTQNIIAHRHVKRGDK